MKGDKVNLSTIVRIVVWPCESERPGTKSKDDEAEGEVLRDQPKFGVMSYRQKQTLVCPGPEMSTRTSAAETHQYVGSQDGR